MGSAWVFPGQGSQRPGMARPWRDHPAFACWGEADAILGADVTRLGLEADADELRAPAACQRALFVHEVVLAQAWAEATGQRPALVAGHSLGEYVALVVAGALSFADALTLVDVRARATEAAAAQRPGSLVAVLGGDLDVIGEAAEAAGAHIANDNAPGQVVVAGSAGALEALRTTLGGQAKVRDLDVGAAYHSPHMEPAVPPLRAALEATAFAEAAPPVVANVDAAPHAEAQGWPDRLARQVTAPVRWRETVERLAAEGIDRVVELGASSPLSGMVKRIRPELERVAVTAPQDLPG